MKFNKVEEVLEIIEQRRLNKNGISAFKQYMQPFIDKKPLKCIHIAGTNGKGSTLHYCAKILEAHGYRVGTISSPALISHFDRIQINGMDMEKEKFLEYANAYYDSWMEYGLSMFEIDVFLAYLYFQEKEVDYAIFEVGLGGEKDATNIVSPIASVITNIGMDHMQLLGNTYEEIAQAKAGIVKENTPLFTSEEKEECLQVFKKKCKDKDASFIQVLACDYEYKTDGILLKHELGDIKLHTLANYQVKNACLAIAVIKQVLPNIDFEKVKLGLYSAFWRGRFEMVHTNPLMIVDGAHNVDGVKALCETLKCFPKTTIVFSALKDKNFKVMIEMLRPYAKEIIVCENSSERSSHEEDYESMNVRFEKDYRRVIDRYIDNNEDLIITGSLYFVSDVRAYLIKDE